MRLYIRNLIPAEEELLSIAALLSKGEPLPFTETEENEPILTVQTHSKE